MDPRREAERKQKQPTPTPPSARVNICLHLNVLTKNIFLFVSYEYIVGSFALINDYLQRTNEAKEDAIDMERLASARKRLHENYREAENGKLQNINFHLPHHLKPIYGY